MQTFKPLQIVLVCDGWGPKSDTFYEPKDIDLKIIWTSKHEPGKEQPRNIGARLASRRCTHLWFLDSDCLPLPNTLEEYVNAARIISAYTRVLIGPYDWMEEGSKTTQPDLYNDPRWDMFNRFEPMGVFQGHLGVALGCFSGNLVWPIEEFKRVGGFWNDLHAGRCEDGELGIRASAMCVPMSLVKEARCFHMGHAVDINSVFAKNERDVPLINKRHPYIEKEGIIVADRDGKRFEQICRCGQQINTLDYWKHATVCKEDLYV